MKDYVVALAMQPDKHLEMAAHAGIIDGIRKILEMEVE